MERTDRLNLYRRALKEWGNEAQVLMTFEECGELINALAKFPRERVTKEDVITELADVTIMCEQLALLFGYGDFQQEKENKLKRLEERLNKKE